MKIKVFADVLSYHCSWNISARSIPFYCRWSFTGILPFQYIKYGTKAIAKWIAVDSIFFISIIFHLLIGETTKYWEIILYQKYFKIALNLLRLYTRILILWDILAYVYIRYGYMQIAAYIFYSTTTVKLYKPTVQK